jgi:hypothetical protein
VKSLYFIIFSASLSHFCPLGLPHLLICMFSFHCLGL